MYDTSSISNFKPYSSKDKLYFKLIYGFGLFYDDKLSH